MYNPLPQNLPSILNLGSTFLMLRNNHPCARMNLLSLSDIKLHQYETSFHSIFAKYAIPFQRRGLSFDFLLRARWRTNNHRDFIFKLTSFRFEIFFLLGYNISIFYSFSSRWREVYKSANPRNQFNFPADYIPARDLRRGIPTFCRWGNSAEAARDKYFLRISRETD